jgi:hypothetical protein
VVFAAAEKDALRPLPADPFVLATWAKAKIGPDIHARVGKESALCYLLLINRSPFLHDLTSEFLVEVRAGKLIGTKLDGTVHAIHRALASLGYVIPPPSSAFTSGPVAISGTPQAWAELERWHDTVHPDPESPGHHPDSAGQDRPVDGRRAARRRRADGLDLADLRVVGRGGRPDERRRLRAARRHHGQRPGTRSSPRARPASCG